MLVLKGECINGWNEKLSTAIGFGIVTLLILASITSMIMALLLKFTNINEGTLTVTILYSLFYLCLCLDLLPAKGSRKRLASRFHNRAHVHYTRLSS